MSSEEYQELGRRYYKLKQYEQAVEAFTQGIDIAPSLSLYDYRAAAYDRLKNYSAAVKDGREMIKLDKQDVKGYLRTASVLEKLEKLDTALGIYKYGMKNVPVGDKNFKILQQLHDKTTRKLSPAKSVDPLTVLPVELAEMVLEYLSFKNIVNDMRVSRGWRDYLSKLPRLWMHLDMAGARKAVPRSFVDKAVRRSQNRLTRVTVHRFEHVDILKNIARMCKSLAELEFISLPHMMSSTLTEIILHAPNLSKLVVHPETTADTVTQMLNSRPNLKHISFGGIRASRHPLEWKGPFPELETFIWRGSEMLTSSVSLGNLLVHTPHLRTLNVSHLVEYGDFMSMLQLLPLTTLIMRKVKFGQFLGLPSTLQRLVIEYQGSFELSGNDHILLQPKLPALTHLALTDINQLSPSIMEDFLDRYIDGDGQDQIKVLEEATLLQSLSIRGFLSTSTTSLFNPQAPGLFTTSKRILTPSLQTLDIATLPCNDDEIEYLLSHKTSLTSINISSTHITGESIKMLADQLPLLKTIRADNCPRISGRAAIEYARLKGVMVSCSMEEGKGSRKVRY
ncbi:hypothetical protein FB567DRAFT_560978 [Paraphoma chrysanthemicola]|uniref:F-box domain-containing protein n=1 Tax=Paraphoma chrysanthemicola TaxID=798071 RepID=A0A8K0VXC0_9PLEO|nr:hypothetical protein FB567DRAFT_560978 [Paraphoma chrysanthemicola]